MINMPYFLREKLHYPRGVVRDNGYWEIETDDLPLDPAGWVGEECRVYNINGGFHHVTIKEDDAYSRIQTGVACSRWHLLWLCIF